MMNRADWVHWFGLRLAAAIAAETVPGLGGWPPAWDMVEAPSRALLRELREIERGGGSRERAAQLGEDVLAAWRRAGMRWAAVDVAA